MCEVMERWKEDLDSGRYKDFKFCLEEGNLVIKVISKLIWLGIKAEDDTKKSIRNFENKTCKDFLVWFENNYFFRIDYRGKANKIISEIILDDKKREIILILS